MISRYKRRSILGLVSGLCLAAAGLLAAIGDFVARDFAMVSLFIGIGVYIWGCAALARAKGYSTAIVLTAVIGLLLPMVVLLVLRDKNPRYRPHDRG